MLFVNISNKSKAVSANLKKSKNQCLKKIDRKPYAVSKVMSWATIFPKKVNCFDLKKKSDNFFSIIRKC